MYVVNKKTEIRGFYPYNVLHFTSINMNAVFFLIIFFKRVNVRVAYIRCKY